LAILLKSQTEAAQIDHKQYLAASCTESNIPASSNTWLTDKKPPGLRLHLHLFTEDIFTMRALLLNGCFEHKRFHSMSPSKFYDLNPV